MRNLLAEYARKVPIDLRTYLLPFIYGLFGGLAAVGFQRGVNVIFSCLVPSARNCRLASLIREGRALSRPIFSPLLRKCKKEKSDGTEAVRLPNNERRQE